MIIATDGRQCGDCTACCTVTMVPELKKPIGTTCSHCDSGCTIYENRPESCKKFECAWLQGDMNEDMRPDKSGFVIERLTKDVAILLPVSVFDPRWKSPSVEKVLRGTYVDRGISVVSQNNMALIPDGVDHNYVASEIYKAAKELGVI